MWTKNQQLAIDTRDKSLLVSAAAGSGKTAILVERIVKIILEDRVDVDKLLVVTFTKAAAEEMRMRLYKNLVKAIEENPAERSFINKQISNLPIASISTLHSFCLNITKRYFHVIQLDPGLGIGDETQIAILKDKAMEELLEGEYEKEDERFFRLLEMFNNRRDEEEIKGIINKTHLFLKNRPFPEEWTRQALERFEFSQEDFDESIYYSEFARITEKKMDSAKNQLFIAREIAVSIEKNEKVLGIIDDEIAQLKLLHQNLKKGYLFFYKALINTKYATLRITCEDQDAKEQIKEARDKSKEIVKKIKDSLEYNPPETMLHDVGEMLPEMAYLMDMVFQYDEIFRTKKLEKRVMDFNDMEHYTLQILQNEEVASELKANYQFIFVDEYQDSNEIQDTIISKIMREDNVFFVGDVKQSIYRFRMADPTLFLDKQEKFRKVEEVSKETIALNQNFRSRKKIIDFINAIFENVMSEYIGEVTYDDEAKLYLGAQQPFLEEQVEMTLIENDKDSISNEEIMEMNKIEAEAIYMAAKIKEVLNYQIYDGNLGAYRNITYGDMVILLRTTRGWSDIFYEVLNNEGIPVFAESQTGYFDTLEIRLIVQLIKVIDNLYQDIPLLGVMRSPIFSFSIEEITEIRICDPKSSVYGAILSYMDHGEDKTLSGKLIKMVDKLISWKKQCRYMPIHDFIWKLVMETGYYYYISAMPGGTQRQANIRILIDRAKQYSQSHIKGLFNFIRLIEGMKETKKDLSSAKVIGPSENVVRIMSIHKSKGLEFPVVFIGGLGKRMNLQDLRDPIIMHKDLGLCPNYVNLEERRYAPTIFKTIAKEKIHLETLSEEMRVLYVAMSRSRDYLFLVGSVDHLEKSIEKEWKGSYSEYDISTGKSYLDWIMPVLLNHQEGEDTLGEMKNFQTLQLSEIYHFHKQEQLNDKWNIIDYLNGLEVETQLNAEIESKLSWTYHYKDSSILPTKATVTELKNVNSSSRPSYIKISESFQMPKFLEEKRITGTQRGNIVHFILQHINLNGLKVRNEPILQQVEEEISRMVVEGLLIESELDEFYPKKIAGFLSSNLGNRMINAQKIYREKPFNLKKVLQNDSDDYLLIQGIIDCFFIEGEQYILIDYKSDGYANEESKNSIIKGYREQILLYKEAIEALMGKKVAESYLYLFHGNEAILVQ